MKQVASGVYKQQLVYECECVRAEGQAACRSLSQVIETSCDRVQLIAQSSEEHNPGHTDLQYISISTPSSKCLHLCVAARFNIWGND